MVRVWVLGPFRVSGVGPFRVWYRIRGCYNTGWAKSWIQKRRFQWYAPSFWLHNL